MYDFEARQERARIGAENRKIADTLNEKALKLGDAITNYCLKFSPRRQPPPAPSYAIETR